MEALGIIGMVIGIIAIVVVTIIIARHFEKKRTEALLKAAEEMGLTFAEDHDNSVHSKVSGFTVFNKGHSRKMKNVIKGVTDEVEIAIFDYQYTTGSGKHQNTYKYSIASLHSPLLSCPHFTMRPEGLFDKVGGALGFQDIDFDTHPNFSRMFVLKGQDEEGVRKYFGPTVLEFFESRKNVTLEAKPGSLIFHVGRRVKPENLKDLLEDAYQIFGVLVDQKQA